MTEHRVVELDGDEDVETTASRASRPNPAGGVGHQGRVIKAPETVGVASRGVGARVTPQGPGSTVGAAVGPVGGC